MSDPGPYLLIDPPVSDRSPPGEIAAWIRELDAMRHRYAGQARALEQIASARRQAEEWLVRATATPPPES